MIQFRVEEIAMAAEWLTVPKCRWQAVIREEGAKWHGGSGIGLWSAVCGFADA